MAIAKLSIDLEARLTKLESDLKQATSLAEKSAKQIKGAFSGLSLMFTGLAGALSVGALKGAFDKYVDGAASMKSSPSSPARRRKKSAALRQSPR